MNFLRARTLTTAWLGLIAMWLIVLAPLVSQLRVAHLAQQPDAPLCSATLPGDDGPPGTHDGAFPACGYCDLLATHAAMPPAPPVALLLIAVVALATVCAPAIRYTPLGAFPSGRPRAPPAPR
jgi:hypothetical protein